MSTIESLDRNAPEEAVVAFVDSIKQSPERRGLLVQLLHEQASFYDGRGANELARLRGYILAAFEQTGLPDVALPYVLEELESGREPYGVGGAARALRGLARPTSEVVPFLLKAVENIKSHDDAISFAHSRPGSPAVGYTTALTEIFQTLGWLAAEAQAALPRLEALYGQRRNEFSPRVRAQIEQIVEHIRSSPGADDAPSGPGSSSPITLFSGPGAVYRAVRAGAPASHAPPTGSSLAEVELEDQEGNAMPYGAFFGGKPAVLVFFYTRCMNPNKCALTMTKLASLQQAIIAAGLEGQLRTAAITYDPEFDLPPRLKAYGLNRGVIFSDDNKIFRVSSGFQQFRRYFQPSVSYGVLTVNRHAIELFILDSQGEIVSSFSRLQWDVQEVLRSAGALSELAGQGR